MRRSKAPTSWGAGLRSLIVPGWGQLVTNHRFAGWLLIGGTVVAIGAAFLIVSTAGVDAVAWLVEPKVLLVVVAVNWVVAAIRLLATGHAWSSGSGRSMVAAIVLAALVVVPHIALSAAALEIRATVRDVLLLEPAPVSPLPIVTTSTHPPTTSSVTQAAKTPTTLGTLPDTGTAVYFPPMTVSSEPWGGAHPFGGERINVLLLGGDAGPGRAGLRTDSMIVASIDTATGQTALFGIPRNYGGFTFSDGTLYPGSILNTVYSWGRGNPDAFGGIDPGASALIDAIEHLTGLEIRNFVLVDLTGFADLIDAVGGVTIRVPQSIYGPLYDPVTGGYEMVVIPAGDNKLSGAEALAYARARYGTSDYSRMGRQRCILASLVEQADTATLFFALPDVLREVREHVTTDLTVDSMRDFIRVLPLIDPDQIRVIGFDSTWTSGYTPEGYRIPDVERIRDAIAATLADPSSATELGVGTAAEACS